MSGPEAETCHATCLVLGEDGVLIRGPSGAGKSRLALDLLDAAEAAGSHARLVGDDRVRLSRHHGRVVARPHPALTGLVEIRGLGIRRLAGHAEAAVLRLVVDLVPERPRLPEETATGPGTGPETGLAAHATILGIPLPQLVLEPRQPRAYVIRQVLVAMQQDRWRAGAGSSVASRSHPAAHRAVCDV